MINKFNLKNTSQSNSEALIDPLRCPDAPSRLHKAFYFVNLFALLFNFSCKKIVDVAPPTNSITATQVFSRDDQALAAMSGVYSAMISNRDNIDEFCNGALSIYSGASADEINFYLQIGDRDEFHNNNLTPLNGLVNSLFWASAYSLIYRTNAIIEGLETSTGVHDDIKTELIGEAKFIRAFCNFYLVNLFGNVPIITSTNYHKTSLLSRAPTNDVYRQIIDDLKDSQARLKEDYSVGNNERIVPNKGAATALLSRTYLYTGDWGNAEAQASALINSAQYKLAAGVNNVFSNNSTEAIWQLKQNNSTGSLNATPEGFNVIPYDAFSDPFIYLTSQLLKSFEAGDQRKLEWVDSTTSSSVVYYYPRKYKIGPVDANNGPHEYYMVLRIAEQYLIRAEARAKQNKLTEAISDINAIRIRAGLPSLPDTLTPLQVMAAIEQENRIEFFVEWGHRWLDLKRWGRANAVLSPIKGSNWQTTDQLYPIPQYEINTGSNLSQNDGY